MVDFAGHGRISLFLYLTGAVITGASFIMGISDNLPGILLLYAGLTVILIGIVLPWRNVKRFLLLFGVSFAGFFIFVVLHNGMYAFGIKSAGITFLRQIFGVLGGVFFLIAVILCPVGIVVGIIGSTVTFILSRKRKLPKEGTSPEG